MNPSPPPAPDASPFPAPESTEPPTPPPTPGGPPPTSGLAAAALVVGLFSLCVPGLGLVALIMGIVAVNRIDNPAHHQTGRGMATAGANLGGVGLGLWVILVIFGLLLPAVSDPRSATATRMQANIQLRGIHQAMVIYAQGNNGHFPGLDKAGDPDDITVANRYWLLIDQAHFGPDYVISPAETDPQIHQWQSGPFTEQHYSFAMLSIADPGGRREEWHETLKTEAIVMGDRNTGQGADDHLVQSIHTGQPGDWRGGIAYNDNSVSFETTHRHPTRYGSGVVNNDDNLFEAQGPDDALLIHAGE